MDFSVMNEINPCQYNIILGREMLKSLEMIIDFQSEMIVWQKFKIPMKDPAELHMNDDLYAVFSETLEPEAIKDSNKCITKILDARYKKANLEKNSM